MQMSIEYLGLTLKSPLIVSASPMSQHTDRCRALEDHGAAAIVMHSLFEEQINAELHEVDHMLFHGRDAFSEALSFFPEGAFENYEMENYLGRLRALKTALDIPVIASLNGVSTGGWTTYAKMLEDAGADALELNLYYPANRAWTSAEQIEAHYLEAIASVRRETTLPFAVKLAPAFTALPHFLKAAEEAGATAAVLFNRFYQSDIDLEALEWTRTLSKSSPADFAAALRAVAVCYGQSALQFCAGGGVTEGNDIVKAVMAGANTVAAATVFHERGEAHAAVMLAAAERWMTEHEYESFDQMRGAISYAKAPNPSALERANYVDLLRHGDELWF
ncbi:dihydroorotate dehydrogenase-like protein [Sulfurimonas diazotrophicus]|uniref:Dihydroorotate dehydrogenase-like protein n=1 Tax=Sulfurimonas diazotrophicus TaxID=3131939 RepID=A0ABZ3H7V9_9BACT